MKSAAVRAFEDRDLDAVVGLSLRAWAPVYASFERVLGEAGGYAQQHPDWRVDQRQAVEAACRSEQSLAWVAETDGVVAGFVVARSSTASPASVRFTWLLSTRPTSTAGSERC